MEFISGATLGFTKITFPLELICPAILEGVDPKTLFNEEDNTKIFYNNSLLAHYMYLALSSLEQLK